MTMTEIHIKPFVNLIVCKVIQSENKDEV